MKDKKPKICVICGKTIPWPRNETRNVKYCSKRCSQLNNQYIYHRSNPKNNNKLCTGTTGAINEYRVIIDLMGRNYSVFRACSPSCPCDIVVFVDTKLLRVEVTTGHYTNGNRLKGAAHDPKNFDLLAIVTSTGEIVYEPKDIIK